MNPRCLHLFAVLLIAMLALGGSPSQSLADCQGCGDYSATTTSAQDGTCGAAKGNVGEACQMAQGCSLQAAKMPVRSVERPRMPIDRIAYRPTRIDAAFSTAPQPELTPPRT
ncbi:MAG: hypothetical protein ACREEP_19535 [Dongiaceae bacterium]